MGKFCPPADGVLRDAVNKQAVFLNVASGIFPTPL